MRIRALSLSLLLLTACGDPAIVGPPELRGEWLAVFLGEADGHTDERMTFGRDGSFRHEILWYGYYGLPATTLTGYAQSLGRYRMQGETLMLRIARFEEWQKYAVGPNPRVVTTRKPEWAERGTVHVENDRLFHTFLAAPLRPARFELRRAGSQPEPISSPERSRWRTMRLALRNAAATAVKATLNSRCEHRCPVRRRALRAHGTR